MDDPLAMQEARLRARATRLSQHFCKRLGIAAGRHRSEVLTVVNVQRSVREPAESASFLQDYIEYRLQITRRGIDDPQNLGGGGLLLQCLARLGNQPRVLDCDDRLRGEVLQQ